MPPTEKPRHTIDLAEAQRQRIRDDLEVSGRLQSELARLANVNEMAISRILSGKMKPTGAVIEAAETLARRPRYERLRELVRAAGIEMGHLGRVFTPKPNQVLVGLLPVLTEIARRVEEEMYAATSDGIEFPPETDEEQAARIDAELDAQMSPGALAARDRGENQTQARLTAPEEALSDASDSSETES